ncbi:unnamed protein product [Dovyalis caffra]|uniref:Pectinesterase inhibitor domain-containing protein n=1 Tax=Dovyalis caffra TaxID=77055 RepID=A0AAV1RUY9_9ROSI|nr:unnamed protein product [Dovyalis caffra]
MASVPSHSSLFSLVLILFFIHFAQCEALTQELIDKICHGTQDYNLCIKIFKDNVKSPTTDLVGLTHLTIDLALKNAIDTCAYTQRILDEATTPEVRKVLGECVKDYQLVVEGFQQASTAFAGKKYKDMVAKESATPAAISACERGMPPAFPVNPYFFLIERDKQLKVLISMSVVTGKLLCSC